MAKSTQIGPIRAGTADTIQVLHSLWFWGLELAGGGLIGYFWGTIAGISAPIVFLALIWMAKTFPHVKAQRGERGAFSRAEKDEILEGIRSIQELRKEITQTNTAIEIAVGKADKIYEVLLSRDRLEEIEAIMGKDRFNPDKYDLEKFIDGSISYTSLLDISSPRWLSEYHDLDKVRESIFEANNILPKSHMTVEKLRCELSARNAYLKGIKVTLESRAKLPNRDNYGAR